MTQTTPSSVDAHTTWTVGSTAYLRNLNAGDLRSECIAVHYQRPPQQTERGTSISLKMPVLIVSLYSAAPRDVADRVAAILNKHWDDQI
jgi:hypothetical protein